ncbi:hypothetical protein CVT26_001802 [Gymnopilus dilepis]|uniref:DNA 3'-5' helicase n=1 Tax=Gymnopilus dilepis TaxID=231916 RepID=A0A409Y3Z0_9AGAR|nr:hypothetical protein CVT26_001802 [Gymnopilus dilepis]
MSSLKIRVPTIAEVREEVKRVFGITPCNFQARDAIAQLERKDCITIARTGSGKTLTFWAPLLFNDNGIIIVVTALNILGDQNVAELARLHISAVNVTGETATDALFKEIEAGQHRAIVVSPEKILNDSRFERLWENKKFTSRLFNISFDEAHCISQWGKKFRPEYADLGRLRWLVPRHVCFHAVSATMPEHILNDVRAKLQMRFDRTTIIRCSNDRPNIYIMVEEMKYPASSAKDLERILRLQVCNVTPPPKFMIFANKRKETESIVEKLWQDLPEDLREKIIWFHSGMSSKFREKAIQQLRDGEVWGFLCTDAAGMGLNLPDVELVIQWRYVASLCTLTQRLGRGGRRQGTNARGIYLVEPQYFDGAKKKVTYGKKRKGRKNGPSSRLKRQKTTTIVLEGVEERGDLRNEEEDDESASEQDENMEEAETQTQASPESGDLPRTPTTLPNPVDVPDEEEYDFIIMDAFINARARGICRREVLDHYFGNRRAGTYLQLILHRAPKDAVLAVEPPDKLKAKRKVNFKNYTMDSHDKSLADALDNWRVEQSKKDGVAEDDFFGAHFILCDEILNRIVSLAHHFKIPTLDDLAAQTSWCFAKDYGSDILKIVKVFFSDTPTPNPPTANNILGQSSLTNTPGPSASNPIDDGNANALIKEKRKRTCKNCGSESHIYYTPSQPPTNYVLNTNLRRSATKIYNHNMTTTLPSADVVLVVSWDIQVYIQTFTR